MVITWSPRAAREFRAIVTYLSARSRSGASRVTSRILKRIDDLLLIPEQGAPIGRGARRLEVTRTPYLIFYRIMNDEIVLIGIVHGKRRRRT
ncbi:MAG TPA: type II toxin-antitoxin system RelE/ParE family toxin [Terricaulis sp.]|nr:type II toxin-antitoxin system RelE/ParE family toxin [Terricaulis sp.]